MLKDKRKIIEDIFKEMYDLKIEYKVYDNIIVNAVTNIAICEFNEDEAGEQAWTEIRDGYTEHQETIKARIYDLHMEAMRLKAELQEEES